eukprot:TRINITY_DN11918_c0_g2_i7.p2 TRINITY_DN11918_c0_g2~~TRINITY_DN11918_c0_g2_i7.p2  ORF type:complete len:186 (+),score=27.28 TRINITY_DN11918_c0_g2_i7:161-718(+)
MTFGSIKALQRYDDQQRAQELLERAAKQVLPIMAKRSWKVTLLVEFFPNNPNLLGLNVNRTQKICVRLRPHRNPRSFYPYEDILDTGFSTLLHELAHIVRGPHDTVFYKQLDELKDEAETLMVRQQFGIGPAALPQVGQDWFGRLLHPSRAKAVLSEANFRSAGWLQILARLRAGLRLHATQDGS